MAEQQEKKATKKAAASPTTEKDKAAEAKQADQADQQDATTPTQAAGAAARGEERPKGEAPRPDTVEGLSSAKALPQQGADGDAEKRAENVAKAQEEGSVFSGPNHDLPDPTPENTARTPAQMVRQTSEGSGPLEPPTDSLLQSDPVQGYALSSTDHTYASTGGQTIAGEQFHRFVDEDGNEVGKDDLFDMGDGTKTFVTTKKRIFEEFYYPNTTEVAKRLVFIPGKRVNRAEAERIKATL